MNASTGELLAPTATRLGPVTEKVVRTVEAVKGLHTLERALTGAELDRLEGIVKECVAQAHTDVNETYQQQNGGFKFKNGKFPNDAEYDRAVRFTERGRFPCYEKHRLDPMNAPRVRQQLTGYQKLSNRCPVALVTPGGLKQLGID